MRFFLLLFLMTLFNTPLFALESVPAPNLSGDWISRPSPETPATDEEDMAVLVASKNKSITTPNMIATYDGMDGAFKTVTVITLPETDPEVQIISRFRVNDNQICESTRPAYKTRETAQKEKNEAERLAYQLAVNANGRDSIRPLISGNKMLAVKFGGKCNATVIEKNMNREVVAEYRFKVCN